VQSGISGLLNAQTNAPPFFALLTSLFYEPLLWLFALAGFVWLAQQGALTLTDRFLALWVVLGGIGGLIYQGTGPDHAAWLVIPLAGLVTVIIAESLQRDEHPFLDVPGWGKPVGVVVLCALLLIFATNFQGVVRAFLHTVDGSPANVQPDPINTVWTIIALLFIITGAGMVASLWGRTAALRIAALGVLVFGLVTSLGSGWGAAVTNADNPLEFWHVQPTSRETYLLRESLMELSQRESGGFPYLTIYAQADDSGVVGWLLRDFVNTRYISQPSEGRTQEVVLLPGDADLPDLGGSYVGQSFIIERSWYTSALQGLELLPWWTQRRARTEPVPTQVMVLWLRQDIYDGVDFVPGTEDIAG
jgi:hypothetical protein